MCRAASNASRAVAASRNAAPTDLYTVTASSLVRPGAVPRMTWREVNAVNAEGLFLTFRPYACGEPTITLTPTPSAPSWTASSRSPASA